MDIFGQNLTLLLSQLVAIAVMGYGVWLSQRTGWLQLRRLGVVLSETLGALRERSAESVGQITPFQSAMIALSGTFGTGYVVGVVAALLLGGPGALFWLWVFHLLGAGVRFSEAVLAVHFRRNFKNGSVMGGPMMYILRGLGKDYALLARLHALLLVLGAFIVGNLTQSSVVGTAFVQEFQMPPAVVGLLMAAVVGLVLSGGIARIARAAQWMVPLKGLLLLMGVVPLLAMHAEQIPAALASIFTSAFGLGAAAGGAAGAASFGVWEALRHGLGRAALASEVGVGSSAIAYAQGQVDHPVRQGFWGIAEVFLGMLGGTLVGLTFLTSKTVLSGESHPLIATRLVFADHPLGVVLLALMLVVFALGTMMAWSFYGEQAAVALMGDLARMPYRLTFVTVVFMGGLIGWSDGLINTAALMYVLLALPNLFALTRLAGTVVELVQEFFSGKAWQQPRSTKYPTQS